MARDERSIGNADAVGTVVSTTTGVGGDRRSGPALATFFVARFLIAGRSSRRLMARWFVALAVTTVVAVFRCAVASEFASRRG
jgi:hypothetical protein